MGCTSIKKRICQVQEESNILDFISYPGATLSKGFNRALGTLSAGALALGAAELSTLAGKYEEVLIIFSIFTVGMLKHFVNRDPYLKSLLII